MPLREALSTVRMERVAVVGPTAALRRILRAVGESGTVEFDEVTSGNGDRDTDAPAAAEPAENTTGESAPSTSARETELDGYTAAAVVRGDVAGLVGWTPATTVQPLTDRLRPAGGAIVRLPRPRWAVAPTLLSGTAMRRSLAPLVETYGTVPYADVDPTVLAAASYVLMFGMMFGDVGHGLLVLALAFAMRAGWPRQLARFRRGWPLVAGAGLAATLFGFLYGEAFGPTGLVPVLWLAPLDRPVPLLVAALGVGAVLLASAYALGTVNRWREGGWPLATFAPSGVAGTTLFAGVALIAAGWSYGIWWPILIGTVTALAGLLLAFAGFVADAGGGGAGWVQATVELFDTVVRLASNVMSFARLAAFGLTHAALGSVVWDGSHGLWTRGGLMIVGAGALFLVGNALAFALEALVAAIQTLRLEYYELFSRVFQGQGRPFRPWRLSTDESGEPA